MQDARPVILQRGELKTSRLRRTLLKLLADLERSPFKVHTIPCQAQSLRLAQAGEQDHLQHISVIRITVCGGKIRLHLCIRERDDLRLFYAGQVYHVAGISCDVAQLHGLRKGLCEDTVDVPHSFCIERGLLCDDLTILFDDLSRFIPLGNGTATGQQVIIKALDKMGREFAQLHSAEGRLDVRRDLCSVGLDRAVLLRQKIVALPNVQPLRECQARWFYVKPIINTLLRIAHGHEHFFLCIAVNAPADGLACTRVGAHGDPCFPSTIRPLPDASGSAGITLSRHAALPHESQ